MELFWGGARTVFAAELLCPGVWLESSISPGLSDTEKRLVCGDPDRSDAVGRAWSRIPRNQAIYHLKTFFQDRALYQASFRDGPEHSLWVDPGPVSRASSMDFAAAVPVEVRHKVDLERKRKVIGEPLTPKLLSALEQWVVQRLQAQGHGCPLVRSTADAQSGVITLEVEAGPAQNLISITEESFTGVLPGILRRYDAFRLGDPFDIDLLSVTESRVLSDKVVQSHHFTPQCTPLGVIAHEKVVPGPPRYLAFGFGVDTEGLLRAQATWSNTRLGAKASSLQVGALATSKVQSLATGMNWYVLSHPSRFYLKPRIEFKHQNEEPFEALSAQLSIAPATSWDNAKWGLSARLGPSWSYIRTIRGAGPKNSHLGALEGEIRAVSHRFEFYRRSPRSGISSALGFTLVNRNLLADLTAQKLRWSGEALLNLAHYDPPLLIFGVRWGATTIFTPDRPGLQTRIPASFLEYLGGSRDLRGFGRDELPQGAFGTGTGGISSAFAGLEVRLGDVLPHQLQPFVFLDAGALGREPVSLDPPTFLSPGGGLRWESPIGSIRSTLAHGIVLKEGFDPLSHWQFYFSFGEEF